MLAEIRTGIVDTLARLDGVNVYPHPVDNLAAPAAIVAGVQAEPDSGDSWRCTAEVYVVVSRRHVHQLAQLDELLDPSGTVRTSVVAALLAEGSTVDVSSIGEYREFTIGDVGHYAATVTVEVLTHG